MNFSRVRGENTENYSGFFACPGGRSLPVLWEPKKPKQHSLETEPLTASLKLPNRNSNEGELKEFIASSHQLIVALNNYCYGSEAAPFVSTRAAASPVRRLSHH